MASRGGRQHDAPDPNLNNRTAPPDSRSADPLGGRPDLEKDALKELRARQRALKNEAKRVATDLKKKKKQKKRALKRCAALDSRDLVQVLLERGIVLGNSASSSSTSSAHSAPPRQESRPEAADPVDHPSHAVVVHASPAHVLEVADADMSAS